VTVPLVVGLGRADRGDDAIGPEVARAFAARCGTRADVAESEQPADLMDVWSGRELVVIVDAVRSGASPGTIHVLHLGADDPGFDTEGRRTPSEGGSHALGLESVVGLAGALGLLPSRLVLVGVEGTSFDYGDALSPAVADAVEATVDEVMAQVLRIAPARPPGTKT